MDEYKRTKLWAAVSTVGSVTCFALLATMPMLSSYGVVLPGWVFQVIFTSVNAFTCLAFMGIIRSAMLVLL